MSESPPLRPPYQLVEGFPIPGLFNAEATRSVIRYKPRDDDLFVCGCNTWAQHTMALILRQGEPFGEDFNFMDAGAFLEVTGMEVTKHMPRPCVFKTHLPFHLAPWSDKAKYIYITRNPKDACVSSYHHATNRSVLGFNGTFNDFFEYFILGDVSYGDFFDHLEEWYKQRNRPNVLFVTYEEMKENPEAIILKMASFADDEKYAEPLRKDRQKLENVLKYSSFEEMKVIINKSRDKMFSIDHSDKSEIPEGYKAFVSEINKNKDVKNVSGQSKSNILVRKGIIGDWRNHFSEDQSRRLDEKLAKRAKDMEIMKFWEKYI